MLPQAREPLRLPSTHQKRGAGQETESPSPPPKGLTLPTPSPPTCSPKGCKTRHFSCFDLCVALCSDSSCKLMRGRDPGARLRRTPASPPWWTLGSLCRICRYRTVRYIPRQGWVRCPQMGAHGSGQRALHRRQDFLFLFFYFPKLYQLPHLF